MEEELSNVGKQEVSMVSFSEEVRRRRCFGRQLFVARTRASAPSFRVQDDHQKCMNCQKAKKAGRQSAQLSYELAQAPVLLRKVEL